MFVSLLGFVINIIMLRLLFALLIVTTCMSQNCDNIKNCISEKDAMDYWNQVNDEYKNELDIIVKTVLLAFPFHFVVH